MPLAPAALDRRTYQQLLDESLARVPVHNPEWTNFNASDPGVTLLELFAFLAESVIYRANLIPDRNRLKFLSLLGVPLQPASAARGLVTFANERGPLAPITLPAGTVVSAGKVPFCVEEGLDVLPIEATCYFKREQPDPTGELLARYQELYTSHRRELPNAQFQMYDTVPLAAAGPTGVDLGQDTVGGAVWLALLYRALDKSAGGDPRARAREAIASRTLSLGFVPAPEEELVEVGPAAPPDPGRGPLLQIEMVTGNGEAGATYLPLDVRFDADVWDEPGVAQVTLPAADQFPGPDALAPLEPGVGDRPPALADTQTAERLVGWLRIRPTSRNGAQLAAQVRLIYVGINAAAVTQRERVVNEVLPAGT
ncbi:MAG TPA: hypothetical protein VKE74_26080, partial [Gemmataceae bacterium]|nr:hypothetical protein [Gemmataceae bacterium]